MTYVVEGLSPEQFAPLFAMDGAALAGCRARMITADSASGYPCRVSLRDADEGDRLLLVHHVNHAVETPYRNAYAIFVREGAGEAARFVNEVPPVFEGRPIAFRGYSVDGDLHTARLAMPGQADEILRTMLEDPTIAYIDAHNAAHGCFAARVRRDG